MDRLAQLAEALRRTGAAAYFVTSAPTMRYLFGYAEEGMERFLAVAVAAGGRVRYVGPALGAEQARRAGLADVRGWSDGGSPDGLIAELAADWELAGQQVLVDPETRADHLLRLQRQLPGASVENGGPLLGQVARKKDAGELAALRRAAAIADGAYEAALARVAPGMTEAQLAQALVEEMRARGGEGGGAIVAAGPYGAEPHHAASDKPLEPGDVVIADFGCTVDGYFSDITRTFAIESSTDEQREVYRVVHEAHHAARKAAAPGVPCQAADQAARQVVERAGYGDYFVHRTGHGIGLRIHEEPWIVAGNQTLLEPGDCFSIEPGIYLPGRFGVRLENIVTVASETVESLNSDPAPELRLVPLGG